MKIKVQINSDKIIKKTEGDEIGKFAAHEWKRLINPYTPHRDGNLERNVQYKPWEITYMSPYAQYIYGGSLYVDPLYQVGGFTPDGGVTFFSRPGIKKINSGRPLKYNKEHNPKATQKWDEAAIRDGQDKKLANALQGWVNKNI